MTAVALSAHADAAATVAVVAIFAVLVLLAGWSILRRRPLRRLAERRESEALDAWLSLLGACSEPSVSGASSASDTFDGLTRSIIQLLGEPPSVERDRRVREGLRLADQVLMLDQLLKPGPHPLEDDQAVLGSTHWPQVVDGWWTFGPPPMTTVEQGPQGWIEREPERRERPDGDSE